MDISIKRLQEFFSHSLWEIDISTLSGFKAFCVRLMRIAFVAIRDFTEGELTMRAMGLVYTTMLSLVPLLAVSFSVLKAFGVHNQIEPFLLNLLSPLGDRSVEITHRIIGFVENVKVGVLGSIGLSFLIYTVISLIQKIESAFNHIWKVRGVRSFTQRFSNYTSVILIGPVLIFSAIGITATVMSTTLVQKLMAIEPFGTAVYIGGKVFPYILVCMAFTFIYLFVPNTHVNVRAAVTGGILAGILWESIGWAFASFIASSTKYTAIYSGFAILILFMIWIYLNWMILLTGASIAFYTQYPQFLSVKRVRGFLSNRLKERLALQIIYLIGSHFHANKPPWTSEMLVKELGVPVEALQEVVDAIKRCGYITEVGDAPPAYIPARDPETVRISDFIRDIRSSEEEGYSVREFLRAEGTVSLILERLERAQSDVIGVMTWKDLINEEMNI